MRAVWLLALCVSVQAAVAPGRPSSSLRRQLRAADTAHMGVAPSTNSLPLDDAGSKAQLDEARVEAITIDVAREGEDDHDEEQGTRGAALACARP
jgi:hypothetical protein